MVGMFLRKVWFECLRGLFFQLFTLEFVDFDIPAKIHELYWNSSVAGGGFQKWPLGLRDPQSLLFHE